jgi:hypothetical protein
MLTSAQGIAKDQASVTTVLNTILQYVPSGSVTNLYTTSFGDNQFLITVVFNLPGGLRPFNFTLAPEGLKAFMKAKQTPTRIKPKLGMKVVPAKKKNGNLITPF